MAQRQTDWFATNNSDSEKERIDEEKGYDSEAGEKRKGGTRSAGDGASRVSKRRRHIESFHDEDEEDLDDEDADGHPSNDYDNETSKHLDSDISRTPSRVKNRRLSNTQNDEQDTPQHNIDKNTTNTKRNPDLRPLTTKSLTATRLALQKTGVIYISRIPPYMKPSKIRSLLSPYGTINRIFLTPEDPQRHSSRVKSGGNKKKRYIDGWVEFLDKRNAKLVAETLNANIIGGKKGGYYHDDVWNLKYLKGFKWAHLTERIANENAERAARLRSEISKTRKEDREFVRNVERAKMLEGMQRKRDLKRRWTENGENGLGERGEDAEEQRERRRPVLFEQKSEIGAGRGGWRHAEDGQGGEGLGDVAQSESVKRVLSKLF